SGTNRNLYSNRASRRHPIERVWAAQTHQAACAPLQYRYYPCPVRLAPAHHAAAPDSGKQVPLLNRGNSERPRRYRVGTDALAHQTTDGIVDWNRRVFDLTSTSAD